MRWQYVIHCFQVKRSSHAGRLKFLQCPLYGSMPIWPIRVICGTNSTNEGTMCYVPLTFPGHKVKVIQVIHICTAEVWEWISNSIPMTNDELGMSHPDLYTRSVMYIVLNQSWRSCTGTVQTLIVWKILKKGHAGPVRCPCIRASMMECCNLSDGKISVQPCQAIQGPQSNVTG